MFLNLSQRWLGSKSSRPQRHRDPFVRLHVEQLEDRCVLSVTITAITALSPTYPDFFSDIFGVTGGPDGNVWFTERHGSRFGPPEYEGRIGRMTPAGVVTEFSKGISLDSEPSGITAGPDGNLWFTESKGGRIGRITTAGEVTEFSIGLSSWATHITPGADGNLWFSGEGGIGRITTAGVVTRFTTGITGSPGAMTAGSDGNLWFTDSGRGADRIGKITPAGVVTEFTLGVIVDHSPLYGLGAAWVEGRFPSAITGGSDGNVWFPESGNRIGRITPAGVFTEFSLDIAPSGLFGITTGPDRNLWFTEYSNQRIGRMTTAGVVTEFSFDFSPFPIEPTAITTGQDGNLWFMDGFSGSDRVGRVSGISEVPHQIEGDAQEKNRDGHKDNNLVPVPTGDDVKKNKQDEGQKNNNGLLLLDAGIRPRRVTPVVPEASQAAGNSAASEPPAIGAKAPRAPSAGLDANQPALPQSLPFVIAALPPGWLGETGANVRHLDKYTAGYGSFVDPTPRDGEAFFGGTALPSSPAADKLDAVTVVEHTPGHLLGPGDLDLQMVPGALMDATSVPGIRRSAIDAVFAQGGY